MVCYQVYPRVGGGTLTVPAMPTGFAGLSPRGRGNHLAKLYPLGVVRSIPAWAGEPVVTVPVRNIAEVYPRVGGGTDLTGESYKEDAGLSPRGRGNRVLRRHEKVRYGSIPAWAGEPETVSRGKVAIPVYPRVGGGTVSCGGMKKSATGLSPRGRGNPPSSSVTVKRKGSIPAWAGEPANMVSRGNHQQVYPRVGGGTTLFIHPFPADMGLSPRGRGNRYWWE